MTNAIAKVITVDGWTLDVTDEDPRVRDIDLAERAGLKQPRDIRKVIERSREELEEFGPLDKRVHCARYESRPGVWQEREITEFWLTEPQATTILLQLRTLQARRVRVSVVKVFIAARRGLLSAPQPVPVLPTSPTLGDLYRGDVKARCAMTARCTGQGIHRVQGWLRSLYGASGVYRINGVFYGQVCRQLESWALGRAGLPSMAPRMLKSIPDQTQGVLQFPGVP